MEGVKAPNQSPIKLKSYEVDDMKVMLYGKVAVITGRVTKTAEDKDKKELKRQDRFTDVFVWKQNRWQLVAGHESRLVP